MPEPTKTNLEIAYCTNCWTTYPINELIIDCVCHIFGEHEHRIITKSGIKVFKQLDAYCKNCAYKHTHKGELWV